MCAKKKESAEQKLLKMIEASSGVSAQSTEIKKVDKNKSTIALVKSINFGLLIMIFVALLFLGNEVRAGIKGLNQEISFSEFSDRPVRVDGVSEVGGSVHDKSFYLVGVNDRNIFQPFVVPEKQIGDMLTKNRKILQKTANLRLVGIAWLDTVDSASVMIEDTEKGKTYFLKKGQKIGDIIVKTIYADSAVLGYEDEEIVIRYEKNNTQK